MVSSPPPSTANFGSAFNLSSPTISAPKPAPQAAPKVPTIPQSNASMFDPWGSGNDNSPWAAPEPAPAKPAPPKVELGRPPAHLTPNDISGGWAEPISTSRSKPAQPPAVTADEDFGGWTSASTTQTPAANAPKASGGGFGGAPDPFDNPWG
jgi:stromal membrane-associated protein